MLDMCCVSCSALYVVDLVKFRETAAGDNLRVFYETLSKDPNSLANLDQVSCQLDVSSDHRTFAVTLHFSSHVSIISLVHLVVIV